MRHRINLAFILSDKQVLTVMRPRPLHIGTPAWASSPVGRLSLLNLRGQQSGEKRTQILCCVLQAFLMSKDVQAEAQHNEHYTHSGFTIARRV